MHPDGENKHNILKCALKLNCCVVMDLCFLSVFTYILLLMQLKLLLSIILYIRDHGGLGLSGQKKITKNQLHNTILEPWQYWLGITKPKSAFSTTLNASNRLLQFFLIIQWNFLLTDCLPA